jgi:hypothetical protein
MTVCIRERDRCRICFTWIQRDRSIVLSSTCCQKSYHLFQPIQRRKLPRNDSNRFRIQRTNRTVCFSDLIRRYLRINMNGARNQSNFICYECSLALLDVEQCAKYLRKTIRTLKLKLNKSNRLFTSSLAVKFQKKLSAMDTSMMINVPVSTMSSDGDDEDEFDDIDDDEVC